jgi:hypothetical protein
MSKKNPTTKTGKTKKPNDPLLKKALATTAANIARIEAAERGAKPKPAKPVKNQKAKRMSGLDSAAKVLVESKDPLNAQDLVEKMASKGYWKSPGGKTPHATLHAALSREIKLKGKDSRFRKVERGMFAANR